MKHPGKEALEAAVAEAVLAGFEISGEGWNGEYGGSNVLSSASFIRERDKAINSVLLSVAVITSHAQRLERQRDKTREALSQCQKVLAALVHPGAITDTTVLGAYAMAVAADVRARAVLATLPHAPEPQVAPTPVARLGPTAEQERLRFEGDLDKWMKIIGAGITGYQPEAYAVMDWACGELVRLRSEHATAAALLAETQAVLLPFSRDADAIHSDWANERRRASLTLSEEVTVGHMRAAKALRNKIAALSATATEGE